MTSTTPPRKEPLRTTKETHPNLPPGLILGEDGKPCKVCNSWQDWAKIKVKKKGDSAASKASNPMAMMAAMAAGGAAASTSASSSNSSPPPTSSAAAAADRSSCPPDTADLGRATWTFLHTTAAYYPLQPSAAQQTQMRALLTSLPTLYPCAPCADDFGADLAQNPPDVSGRLGLSRWLCERHNEVNRKLGKREFGCEWKNLDERWKGGPEDGWCD